MSTHTDRHAALQKQEAQDAARADFVVGLVAMAMGLPVAGIRHDDRRPANVRARQIAMYLIHVGFGLTLARVGAAFGRDRATVAHACNRVEQWRETPAFDALLLGLEACVRSAPSASFP